MKSYFYFSVLLTIGLQKFSNAEAVAPYDLRDDINALIESLRDEIPEVITISSVDVELPENEYLTGHLNVNDGQIKGIKEFDVEISYVLIIPTGFTFVLDSISVSLEYLADLALFNIPLLSIFGQGAGRVDITNLTVNGKISYRLIPLNVSINTVHISLGDAQFNFDGLLNDETFSNLLNEVLNDNVAKLINENEGAISGVVEDAINTIIGGLLSNSTAQGIIDGENLMNNAYHTEEEGILKVFEILIGAFKSMIN